MRERSPHLSPREEPERITRRRALKTAIAALVGSALPLPTEAAVQAKGAARVSSWNSESLPKSDLERLLDPSRQMKYWREELEKYRSSIRSSESHQALASPANSEAAVRMLKSHPPCFFSMLNSESKRMVREYFDKRSVWIRRSGNELKMYAPGKVKIGFNSLIEESAYSSYGNGIMMRSGKHLYIATNLHVIEAVDPRSDNSVLAKSLDGPDVGFYEITEASIRRLGLDPRDAIDVASPVPAQKNRNGNIILGRSFDPDRSKGVSRIPGGFKEFFGIEHEMSPAFIEATGANPIWTHKSFFLASSGEAEARFRHVPNTSESGTHTKQYMFISGCSGSGLARYADGKIRFAGLITLGGHLAPPKITGEDNYANDFSMAGFETSETVFEMLKDPRRIFQFDNIVPANTNGQWQTNTQKAD